MVGLREMARADEQRAPPAWLRLLLDATFNVECPEHPDASRANRSVGCNFFCVQCTGRPLCYACVAGDHSGHQVIQVRRSSNHSVVKVKDLEAEMNVGGVQPYLINGDNVVFLKKRPMAGQGRSGEYRCDNCSRALLSANYRFCSLKCKTECMEWDFDLSFGIKPKQDEEPSGDDSESDDDSSRPTKLLQNIGSSSGKSGRGNKAEEDGAGTSAPVETQATPANDP